MTDNSNQAIALGKQKILDGVIDTLRSFGVKLCPLGFQWQSDAVRSQLLLLVNKGKRRFVLRFNVADVQSVVDVPGWLGLLETSDCAAEWLPAAGQ